MRLPDTDAEWRAVGRALEALRPAFKAGGSPRALLVDLVTLRDNCAAWWDSRKAPGSGAACCAWYDS